MYKEKIKYFWNYYILYYLLFAIVWGVIVFLGVLIIFYSVGFVYLIITSIKDFFI